MLRSSLASSVILAAQIEDEPPTDEVLFGHLVLELRTETTTGHGSGSFPEASHGLLR